MMSDLRSQFYWQSCIGCVNYRHVPHFLEHYIKRHRLDPKRARFVVHSNDETVKDRPKVLQALARWGVPHPVLWHGEFDTSEKKKRLLAAQFNIPSESWILTSDADELLDPKFHLGKAVRTAEFTGAAYIRGCMIDRVAPDGALPKIQGKPSLWKQFPLEKRLTGQVAEAASVKMILRRAWVIPLCGGWHGPDDRTLPVYHEFPSLYHFKWDHLVISRLRKREKHYKEIGLGWWAESKRLADHLEQKSE